MMVLLGDVVTIQREVAGETTWVTGRINGIVQNDNGDLKYFCIKGIDGSFWVSDGWKFSEEIEEDEDDAEI